MGRRLTSLSAVSPVVFDPFDGSARSCLAQVHMSNK